MVLQKIGHSLKSCLVPHFKNKCLFIQEYQIPIIALRALSQLNRPFKKGQLIMKWINSQINQAIKLRCLKIVQTLLSNQEKRRMREKSLSPCEINLCYSSIFFGIEWSLKESNLLGINLGQILITWWRYSIVYVVFYFNKPFITSATTWYSILKELMKAKNSYYSLGLDL